MFSSGKRDDEDNDNCNYFSKGKPKVGTRDH